MDDKRDIFKDQEAMAQFQGVLRTLTTMLNTHEGFCETWDITEAERRDMYDHATRYAAHLCNCKEPKIGEHKYVTKEEYEKLKKENNKQCFN